MPDEEFLNSFRKRYALLQQKLAQAQNKPEEEPEEDDYAPPSQAERLARARRNRLKMPELKDLRQQLTSKAVEQGHLPVSMGSSGEWSKFLPKEDDPGAQIKVATAAEEAGLPAVAAAQLAQMAAKREQLRQQHLQQLSQLSQQADHMKAALHGTLAPGAETGSGLSEGLEKQVGRLRQLQEQQGQVAADLQHLKGNEKTQGPKGSPPMKGKGQSKGKVYGKLTGKDGKSGKVGKWSGNGKGYGDQGHQGPENYENYENYGNYPMEGIPEYYGQGQGDQGQGGQGGQDQYQDWWGGWYPNPWMQAPSAPVGRPRYGRRSMQPRAMMGQHMSPTQNQGFPAGMDAGAFRSPAEMQAINGSNAVLQRARGKTDPPVRATEQDAQPQTKASAWGAAVNEDAPAEAPVVSGGVSGAASTGTAQPAPSSTEEGRRQSAASSATGREGKEKKEKKEKDKDKDKDTEGGEKSKDSKKASKDKKKDPKEDEDAVGKTGSRAQKSWFGK